MFSMENVWCVKMSYVNSNILRCLFAPTFIETGDYMLNCQTIFQSSLADPCIYLG